MSLHSISVFDNVYKGNPEINMHLESKIKCLKKREKEKEMTGFTLLISPNRLLRENK